MSQRRKLGIKWLKFYILWRFPIGFVLGGLGLLEDVVEGLSQGYFGLPIYVAAVAYDVLCYIYSIFVFTELLRLSKTGYKMNVALLCIDGVDLVFKAYSSAMSTSASYGLGYVLFLTLFISTITVPVWVVLNLVYFKRRKFLFFGAYTIHDLKSEEYVEAQNPTDVKESVVSADAKAARSRDSDSVIESQPPSDRASERERGDRYFVAEQKYCRHCGASIIPDASFCNKCGTRLFDSFEPKHFLKSAPTADGDIKTIDAETIEGAINDTSDVFTLDLSILPPRLRRAFMFIEDHEWDRASLYLEQFLDEEPENPYAYIGKALVECKIDAVEELSPGDAQAIRSTKSYSRALLFSNDETRTILLNWTNR